MVTKFGGDQASSCVLCITDKALARNLANVTSVDLLFNEKLRPRESLYLEIDLEKSLWEIRSPSCAGS